MLGALAPAIQLPDLEGDFRTLGEALKKGPVLLVFFKISCPTCQLTFPFLQRLAYASSPASPQLIAVSQDDAANSREFQQRFGIAMPTLIDVPHTFPASNAYLISSVPSLFLIESDGKISFTVEGFSKAALQKLGERFHAAPFRETDRVPDLRPG